MKRVMFVTNSLTGGGAERSMNLVSNELTRRGWDVALVPINSGEDDLVIPICPVFQINRRWHDGLVGTVKAVSKFRHVVRTWKPDVIILNCDLPELFGALLPPRKSLVVVEHSNMAWINKKFLGKVIRKILTLRKAKWVAVSSHLKIWPNGMTPKLILQNPLTPTHEGKSILGSNGELLRLVYIGRLTPEKGPDQALEVSELSGAPLTVMGDGYMREALQESAGAKKLKVTFLGQVRDPWSQVLAGDLLIAPSTSEGDGLVIIEGMKKGVPLLLSDIPDFRRFGLPEKNYCQSADDFVSRINQVRANLDSLRVPEKIAEQILSSRSIAVVGDTWVSFLRSL